MSLPCSCAERPRCQWQRCGNVPVKTMIRPLWPEHEKRVLFICKPCSDQYDEFTKMNWHGVDRPVWADEDWRGSILHHVQFHSMLARDADRREDK